MNVIDLLKYIKQKIAEYNSDASNPFISEDYSYNPFESVFTRTYVWVEKHNNKRD